MSDGVPLKQEILPGEYRIQWALPTQAGNRISLQGDLHLWPDRSPRGSVYGTGLAVSDSVGHETLTGFPQIYEAGLISGQLVNGQHVLIVDAVIEVWLFDRAIVRGRAALVGRSPLDAESLEVLKLTIQVEGIDAIAGAKPIQSVNLPIHMQDGQQYLDWSWQAVGNPESTQTWSDARATVELRFRNSVTAPEGFFFRVSFSPIILVTLTEPTNFAHAFSHWAEPLRRIVSLSTGRKEQITYLSLTLRDPNNGDREVEYQVYGTALHQTPFASRGNDILKVDRAFSVSPDDMSLLALLRRWQDLADQHHPLLETYGSLMFAPDQHPRSRFLLLIQAIEGLYGFETQRDFEQRVVAHSERRDRTLAEAEASLDTLTMKFLRKYVMKRPPSSLDQALTAIIVGIPRDVTPMLKKTNLITKMMNDVRQPKTVSECLRFVRNDLAHGTRGYDFQDLNDVVSILDNVVRTHLLRILGCGEESQVRSQNSRR